MKDFTCTDLAVAGGFGMIAGFIAGPAAAMAAMSLVILYRGVGKK